MKVLSVQIVLIFILHQCHFLALFLIPQWGIKEKLQALFCNSDRISTCLQNMMCRMRQGNINDFRHFMLLSNAKVFGNLFFDMRIIQSDCAHQLKLSPVRDPAGYNISCPCPTLILWNNQKYIMLMGYCNSNRQQVYRVSLGSPQCRLTTEMQWNRMAAIQELRCTDQCSTSRMITSVQTPPYRCKV